MKKNVRNALAISGLAIAIGTSGFALDASAFAGSSNRLQRSHQERILKSRKTEGNFHSRKSVAGIVTAKSDGSLTISRGKKTFTINLVEGARILDRKWNAIGISNIKEGDKIRVFGSISGTIVTAKTVRDVSMN